MRPLDLTPEQIAKDHAPPPSPGPDAIGLLKHFEQGPDGGFAPVAYRCPAGKQTIGWGHVIKPGERFAQPISEAEATRLLAADLGRFWRGVGAIVTVPLTQSMVDALACFAFNVGLAAFQSSTLLQFLNAGEYEAAADQFARWNKSTDPATGKKVALAGLTRRRKAERALFVKDGWPT